MPERVFSKTEIGQRIDMMPLGLTDRVLSGEIGAIDTIVDSASRTLLVQGHMSNEEYPLRAGMALSVTLSFPGNTLLSIAPMALQWSSAAPFVWMVRDAVARIINGGPEDASRPEIVKADWRHRGARLCHPAQFAWRPGAGRGLVFAITGDNYDQLADVAENMVSRLRLVPGMGQAPLAYERTQRHLFVQIDRALAADLDIDITRLGRAPQAVLAGAATLDQTNSGLLITSGFAILVVFLVLGAQFQGFISAVMVMATAPLGLACALSALLLTGQSLMSTARQV